MIDLMFVTHNRSADFEAISNAVDHALAESAAAGKEPVVVQEFAGGRETDPTVEKYLRRRLGSALNYKLLDRPLRQTIEVDALRSKHRLLMRIAELAFDEFAHRSANSTFNLALEDEGFVSSCWRYLASRKVQPILEDLSFQGWLLGQAQELLDRDASQKLWSRDMESYLAVSRIRIALSVRFVLMRDEDLALQVADILSDDEAVHLILIRGALHDFTLQRALTTLNIPFRVLAHPSSAAVSPREEVIRNRLETSRMDDTLFAEEVLMLMRQPLLQDFLSLLRRSGEDVNTSTDVSIMKARAVLDRLSLADLNELYTYSPNDAVGYMYHWILANCTEAEKTTFSAYQHWAPSK